MEKVFLYKDKQSNLIHFSFSIEVTNKGLCSAQVGHAESIGFDIADKDFIFIKNFEDKITEMMNLSKIKENLLLCDKCKYILNKKINIVENVSVTIDGSLYQLKLKRETYRNIPASLLFKKSNAIRDWIALNIKFSSLELNKKNPIVKLGELVFNKAISDARNIHLGF